MKTNKDLQPETKEETTVEQPIEETPLVKLEEDDGTDTKYCIPWKGLIFIGVILTLMVVCIIVIGLNGGFNA